MKNLVLCVVLLAGCKKDEAPKPPEVVVPVSPEVAAYEKDCAHVFLTHFDDMGEGGEKPECESRDFEQNCDPDQDGCLEAEEKCKDGCAKPCDSCQSACATTCSSCKTVCKGDPACVRTCATARQTCRTECLGALNTCRDAACPGAAKACDEAADQKRATLCPDCEGIKAFLGKALFEGNGEWKAREAAAYKGVAKKFPKADKECFRLCTPDP